CSFILLPRPAPRSTLFPYTTLFRSQVMLGAPQTIYNGGLLRARVRYFDVARSRPGLPRDVSALVERLEAERTVVELVNLSAFEGDRKSTRLNSSHEWISYAVFCLKK